MGEASFGEASWRRHHRGGIKEEASWRRHHGGGTRRHLDASGRHLDSSGMHLEASGRYLGGIWRDLGGVWEGEGDFPARVISSVRAIEWSSLQGTMPRNPLRNSYKLCIFKYFCFQFVSRFPKQCFFVLESFLGLPDPSCVDS